MQTREQQLEEALLQKELLTSIFDTVPCGILRLKRTGDRYELVAMNPAAIRLLGYQDTEVSRLDWSSGIADTVIEEDHQMLARSYQTMQKQGDLDNVQDRVRWHDGTIHWLRGNHAIISDCDGVQIIQRMFVDVTESMELQEQLWREQEMYRLAMESSSDMMYEYMIDTDTLMVYGPKVDADGSSSVEKFEYRHSTRLLQQNQVVHPDDLPLITEKLCRGEADAVEVRFRFSKNRQQDYQWYRITARTICHEGRKYRVVGTLRNIHQAKQELDAKREELRMSRAILRAMNGSYLSIYYVDFQQDCFYGIWLPGMDFNVRYVRRDGLYNQLRSYIEREVVAEERKKLYQFLDGRNLAAHLQQPNDCISIEFPTTRGEGKRWLRMDIYMLSKEDGMVCNGVLTVRNVTEERKKELEAQQAEHRAKEALAEAYEAARQGNLAKTDFLSKMSHDIRTP